jgi:hypothetical protein
MADLVGFRSVTTKGRIRKWHKTKATLASGKIKETSGKTNATPTSSKVVTKVAVSMVANRVADRVRTSSTRTQTGGTRRIATNNSMAAAETKTARQE